MVGKGSSGNTECYAIERILGSRMNAAAQLEYLIKWKEPESEKTWESVDNLFSTKMTKIQALSNENSSEVSGEKNRVGFQLHLNKKKCLLNLIYNSKKKKYMEESEMRIPIRTWHTYNLSMVFFSARFVS